MTSLPPSNVNYVASFAAASFSQKDRAVEKDSEKNRKAQQAQEQSFLSDQQEHQVEDTLHLENNRVRKHDEEESHLQGQHKHRALPEDNIESIVETDEATGLEHLDLEA